MRNKLFLLGIVGLIACGASNSYDAESNVVDNQQDVYTKNQPVPVFDYSLPRNLMTQLYVVKNKAVATYSYVQSDYTGKILWQCASIGYPIPANTQLTNPSRVDRTYSEQYPVIPQPEPDGLYSSPSTTGTYVMCTDGSGLAPRYEERPVFVSPVPLHEVNGELIPVPGAHSSFTIDPNKITLPISHDTTRK